MYKRKILTAMTLFVFITMSMTSAQSETQEKDISKYPEKNFETPEAAIKHFIERLAANDLEGALESCNINEMDRFDYKAYTKRLQATILYSSPAPSKPFLFTQINRVSQIANIARQVKFMLYSLLTDVSKEELSTTIYNQDEAKVSAFVEKCNTTELYGLTVVKINLPTPIINTERARKNFIEMARVYGADDATERIVLYKLNESYYWGGMHLLKYEKYWRIDSLNSNFANQNAFGFLQKLKVTSAIDVFNEISGESDKEE